MINSSLSIYQVSKSNFKCSPNHKEYSNIKQNKSKKRGANKFPISEYITYLQSLLSIESIIRKVNTGIKKKNGKESPATKWFFAFYNVKWMMNFKTHSEIFIWLLTVSSYIGVCHSLEAHTSPLSFEYFTSQHHPFTNPIASSRQPYRNL